MIAFSLLLCRLHIAVLYCYYSVTSSTNYWQSRDLNGSMKYNYM